MMHFFLLPVIAGGMCAGLLPAHAQDVAEPDMPNIDLETAEGRLLMEQQKAVIKVLVLISLENKTLPEEDLNRCPAEVQRYFRERGQVGQMSEEAKKQHEKLAALVEKKYDIAARVEALSHWILMQMSREWLRDNVDVKAIFKREFKRIKEGIEAGNIEIPSPEELLDFKPALRSLIDG